jgi:hypothetical protein
MKCAIHMGSDGMIDIPSLMKTNVCSNSVKVLPQQLQILYCWYN